MQEKLDELFHVLDATLTFPKEDIDKIKSIVEAWAKRSSFYINKTFQVNSNIFGKERQKEFTHQFMISAMKMGEMINLNFGRLHIETDVKTNQKFYRIEALVWNILRPEDVEMFKNAAGDALQTKGQESPKLIT